MSKRLLVALLGGILWAIGNAAAVCAQAPAQQPIPAPAAPAPTLADPAEKEPWKGPFGGTFNASLTLATDYSFRGISQTARQVAVQPSFGYETASIGRDVAVNAYVGASGSNFVSAGSTTELDLLAGLRANALGGRLTFDLGYLRYLYLGAPSDLFYDFNELGLVVGYDFQVAQVKGAVYYSPNFYADSGVAWYKWGQVAVPLRFIRLNENIAFKLFGTIGNQYIERYSRYEIGADNYWDWQIGVTATVYGFALTLAYVDTSLDVANCANTRNCEARAVFTLSKSF
jgi:uncharacterized protein (TIGR02001 family)